MASRLLLLCLLVAGLQAVLVLASAPLVVRLPVGVVAVFVLPGLAIALARGKPVPRTPTAAALVVALSVGTVVLAGVALGVVGAGLNPVSWSLGLVLLVAACCGVGLRGASAAATPARPSRPRAAPALVPAAALLAGMTAIALAAAVTVASRAELTARQQFTELSLDRAPDGLHLRVANHEGRRVDYTLRDTARAVFDRPIEISLDAGQSWSTDLQERATVLGGGRGILTEVELFREGVSGPYRTIEIPARDLA